MVPAARCGRLVLTATLRMSSKKKSDRIPTRVSRKSSNCGYHQSAHEQTLSDITVILLSTSLNLLLNFEGDLIDLFTLDTL